MIPASQPRSDGHKASRQRDMAASNPDRPSKSNGLRPSSTSHRMGTTVWPSSAHRVHRGDTARRTDAQNSTMTGSKRCGYQSEARGNIFTRDHCRWIPGHGGEAGRRWSADSRWGADLVLDSFSMRSPWPSFGWTLMTAQRAPAVCSGRTPGCTTPRRQPIPAQLYGGNQLSVTFTAFATSRWSFSTTNRAPDDHAGRDFGVARSLSFSMAMWGRHLCSWWYISSYFSYLF
jgi:hypothetical protein